MSRLPDRLPTGTRHRAIALVERSLPNPALEPTAEKRRRRAQANDRAVLYARQDELSDSLIRIAEKVDELPDGVVVDLVDDEDAQSIRYHVDQLRQTLAR
jgi:hypothetical protein